MSDTICNRDCEHCPYPDCICDSMSYEEYRAAVKADREAAREERRRRIIAQPVHTEAERLRKYRALNPEKVRKYNREYRQKNKEKVAERNRAWRNAHREEISAKRRELIKEFPDYGEHIRESQKQLRKRNRDRYGESQKVIRVFRQSLQLTQAAFGEKLGVRFYTVNKWEHGVLRAPWERIYEVFPEMRDFAQ